VNRFVGTARTEKGCRMDACIIYGRKRNTKLDICKKHDF
jgi:hypothetical protein